MFLKPAADAELLKRFRNGDEKAFKRVYDDHHFKVYQYAYSYLKNREQSEEVVQETFLNIWVNREKLNEEMPVAPYLFSICKRLVLDAFRKAASINALKTNLKISKTEADNHTEEIIMLQDLKRFSEDAIAELPKQQQMVFKLSRSEDLSYEEIAAQLNISKNTVRNHLVVALRTLRAQFESQGIFYAALMIFIKYF